MNEDTSKAAAALGRISTPAKAAAARENGRKGGRPRTQFELVFAGAGCTGPYRIPRHRRKHDTAEAAEVTARAVHAKMREQGLPTACHPGIIYGPGCGQDGRTVAG